MMGEGKREGVLCVLAQVPYDWCRPPTRRERGLSPWGRKENVPKEQKWWKLLRQSLERLDALADMRSAHDGPTPIWTTSLKDFG